jgi:hypothetical protein
MAGRRHFSLKLLLTLVGAVVAGSIACSGSSGGGVSCSNLDPCPKDPPLSQSEIAQCQSLVSHCPAYQAYLNCAVVQIKCTSGGTLDNAASSAAVQANCTSQASGASGCAVSVGFDAGTNCGYAGGSCCATGTACQDGCCDPSAKQCVVNGEQCAGGASVCSNGSCQACGGAGQPCCSDRCNGGACCDISSATPTCVAAGALCAPLGTRMEVCTSTGSCESCGGDLEPCCPGKLCPSSSTSLSLYCDSTNTCSTCGDDGESCCPGSTCPASTAGFTLTCNPSNQCAVCGGDGEPCCPGNTCSQTSTVCSTTTGTPQCTLCGLSGSPCCTTGTPCPGSTCVGGNCQ